MDNDRQSFLLSYDCLPPSKTDLVKIRKSFLSSGVSFEANGGGGIEIMNSSIGLGVAIGKGLQIHNAIVRPQIYVGGNVFADSNATPQPSRALWGAAIAQEIACWLFIPFVGVASLNPPLRCSSQQCSIQVPVSVFVDY